MLRNSTRIIGGEEKQDEDGVDITVVLGRGC